MGRPGFEPETNRLKAECSTAELATQFFYVSDTIDNRSRLFLTAQQGSQEKFAVMRTRVSQLAPGFSLIKCAPVFKALRGAVQGSRQ